MILRSTRLCAFLVNVHPDRIRDWARDGKIHRESQDDLGRPLYNVDEVLRVAQSARPGRTFDDFLRPRHSRSRVA